jgi:hypothetical protein
LPHIIILRGLPINRRHCPPLKIHIGARGGSDCDIAVKCLVLQVIRGCLNIALGTVYNIDDEAHQKTATVLNNIGLGLGVLTTVVNTIISAFDMNEFKGN